MWKVLCFFPTRLIINICSSLFKICHLFEFSNFLPKNVNLLLLYTKHVLSGYNSSLFLSNQNYCWLVIVVLTLILTVLVFFRGAHQNHYEQFGILKANVLIDQVKTYSSIALKPINIRWIRMGSKSHWKIMYRIVLYPVVYEYKNVQS